MKFKIDEHLPVEVSKMFQEKGYESKTVMEQALNGEDDPKIAAVCQREDRVLVTMDTDFSDIRTYPPGKFPGIIVLRLKRQDKPYVLEIFSRLITLFSRESLKGCLWVVDENRVRIRS